MSLSSKPDSILAPGSNIPPSRRGVNFQDSSKNSPDSLSVTPESLPRSQPPENSKLVELMARWDASQSNGEILGKSTNPAKLPAGISIEAKTEKKKPQPEVSENLGNQVPTRTADKDSPGIDNSPDEDQWSKELEDLLNQLGGYDADTREKLIEDFLNKHIDPSDPNAKKKAADIMKQIESLKGLSPEEATQKLAQILKEVSDLTGASEKDLVHSAEQMLHNSLADQQLQTALDKMRTQSINDYMRTFLPRDLSARQSQIYMKGERDAIKALFPNPRNILEKWEAQHFDLMNRILPMEKRTEKNEAQLGEALKKFVRDIRRTSYAIVLGSPDVDALTKFANAVRPELQNILKDVTRQAQLPQLKNGNPGVGAPSQDPYAYIFQSLDARILALNIENANQNAATMTSRLKTLDMTMKEQKSANDEAMKKMDDAIDKQEKQKNANCIQKVANFIVEAFQVICTIVKGAVAAISGDVKDAAGAVAELIALTCMMVLEYDHDLSAAAKAALMAVIGVTIAMSLILTVAPMLKNLLKKVIQKVTKKAASKAVDISEKILKEMEQTSKMAKIFRYTNWAATMGNHAVGAVNGGVQIYTAKVNYDLEIAEANVDRAEAAQSFVQQILESIMTNVKQWETLTESEMQSARDYISSDTDAKLSLTRFTAA